MTGLGVITLGILIALGLEQMVAAHHRAKLAAEAVAGFRHELADNRADVRAAMAMMPKLLEAYGVLRVFLEQERAGRNERRARASKLTV